MMKVIFLVILFIAPFELYSINSTTVPNFVVSDSHMCSLNAAGLFKCCDKKNGYINCKSPIINEIRVLRVSQEINIANSLFCIQTVDNLKVLECWQSNSNKKYFFEFSNYIDKIAIGSNSICTISLDGILECKPRHNSSLEFMNQKILDNKYTEIVAGVGHFCALTDSNKILCFGNNQVQQLEVPNNIIEPIQLAAGLGHTCALEQSGKVVCWGSSAGGRCDSAHIKEAIKISAGATHGCAMLKDKSVKCWGREKYQYQTSEHSPRSLKSIHSTNCITTDVTANIYCWDNEKKDLLPLFGKFNNQFGLYFEYIDLKNIIGSLNEIIPKYVKSHNKYFQQLINDLKEIQLRFNWPENNSGKLSEESLTTAFLFYSLKFPLKNIDSKFNSNIIIPAYEYDLKKLVELTNFKDIYDFPINNDRIKIILLLMKSYISTLDEILTNSNLQSDLVEMKSIFASMIVNYNIDSMSINDIKQIYIQSGIRDLALKQWQTAGTAKLFEQLLEIKFD